MVSTRSSKKTKSPSNASRSVNTEPAPAVTATPLSRQRDSQPSATITPEPVAEAHDNKPPSTLEISNQVQKLHPLRSDENENDPDSEEPMEVSNKIEMNKVKRDLKHQREASEAIQRAEKDRRKAKQSKLLMQKEISKKNKKKMQPNSAKANLESHADVPDQSRDDTDRKNTKSQPLKQLPDWILKKAQQEQAQAEADAIEVDTLKNQSAKTRISSIKPMEKDGFHVVPLKSLSTNVNLTASPHQVDQKAMDFWRNHFLGENNTRKVPATTRLAPGKRKNASTLLSKKRTKE